VDLLDTRASEKSPNNVSYFEWSLH
jgi:hypothetical protein